MTSTDRARLDEAPVTHGRIHRYALPGWIDHTGIVAGITAARPGQDFRLGPTAPSGEALSQWHRLMREVGTGFRTAVVARQVHGSEVHRWGDHLSSGLTVVDGVDGHVTATAGILLAVTVADCVPVYLVQRESGAIALLHAGWRGVAAGVLEAGLQQLLLVGGGTAQTVAMHCGISVCGSCYEVGPEVFRALGISPPPGPRPLDLRSELTRRGMGLGIGAVSVSRWCTVHDRGRFFSYRAGRESAGRMVAYLGRLPA